MSIIQWYPGHIAKLERKLGDLLKLCDVVIEVLDARIPLATTNPRIRARYPNKPLLLLINKATLADPTQTKQWLKHVQAHHGHTAPVLVIDHDAVSKLHHQQVIQAIATLAETSLKALEAKGLKRRPARAIIVGMPNVGKSTVLNSMVGRKKTQTGHKAGVTRQPQWVRIHPKIELLDTPGIIPPQLGSEDIGIKLACVSSVGEASFEEEPVAQYLLDLMQSVYPGVLQKHYGLLAAEATAPLAEAAPSLAAISLARQWLAKGGGPDIHRTARHVLSDFRQGRWGRHTLEWVTGTVSASESVHPVEPLSV